MSFGAYLDKKNLKPKMRTAILNAFRRFPDYEFIWKINIDLGDIKNEYPNVHTMNWVNQVSILAHPKTKAFITHMGLNGFNEAMHYGKPLISVPVYADQPRNTATAVERGVAYPLDRRTLNEESLTKALNEVLLNEK